MGFRIEDLRDDDVSAIPCSICLDVVTAGADRSTARLQCGHQFHLDCIGSAFNVKGVMQCPNCRKIEDGNWLYSSGSRSLPDLSMHEWAHDEDLYDFNYSEMPFVHWCPFERLTQVTSSFEEGESSPAPAFHDLLGHHTIFSEHPATPSAVHPCPYLAYFPPLHPSSTSSSHTYSGGLSPGYWSRILSPADIQNLHALPTVDLQYHNWEQQSPAYSIHGSRASGPDQVSASAGGRGGGSGSFPHPFILAHRSDPRATSGFSSSEIPAYVGNARGPVHVQNQHGSGFRGTRGQAPILPPRPHLFPSPARPSGRDVDGPEGSGFYAWERDPFTPFPLVRVDAEPGWWGPSDSGRRQPGFWQHQHPHHRHHHSSAERLMSQSSSEGSSYRPIHPRRIQPYI